MPRVARIKSKGGFYHVILKSIDPLYLFKDKKDFLFFLSLLEKFSKENSIFIFAYAFMGNHVHLLLKEQEENSLSRMVKQTCVRFVMHYNTKYNRYGSLFQNHFKSEPINNNSYFLTVLRYIHQNPLKANLCNDLTKYPWTSYNDFFVEGGFLNKSFVLDFFKNDLSKFIQFNKEPTGYTSDLEKQRKISDKRILEELRLHFIIEADDVKELSKKEKRKVLRYLYNLNASIRQLSKIFSISKTEVARLL